MKIAAFWCFLAVILAGQSDGQELQRWSFLTEDDLPNMSSETDSVFLSLEKDAAYADGSGLRLDCSAACWFGFTTDSLTNTPLDAVRITVRSRYVSSLSKTLVANTGVTMQDGPNAWNPVEIPQADTWTETSSTITVSGQAALAWISFVTRGETSLQIDHIIVEKATIEMNGDTEFADGTGLDTEDLNARPGSDYALAARVWGLLKYYDKRAYSGQLQWDFEFIRLLHRLAENQSEPAQNVIADWIQGFGEPALCNDCARSSADQVVALDLSWIHNERLVGSRLSEQLESIVAGFDPTAEQYWVSKEPWVGQALFQRELPYDRLEDIDAGFRLLALARVWNMVEYWFPYKSLIDRNWPDVLGEYVPVFLDSISRDEYEVAVVRLLSELDDTHAVPTPAGERFRNWLGTYRLPLYLTFVEDRLLIGGVADSTMDQALAERIMGSEILSIDGESVDALLVRFSKLTSKSNQRVFKRDVASSVINRKTDASTITYVSRDDTLATRFVLGTVWPGRFTHDRTGPAFQYLTPNVGYLKISAAVSDSLDSYLRDIQSIDGLVIDARGYPRGILGVLLPHLIDRPTTFAAFSQSDFTRPGTFIWQSPVTVEPAEPMVNIPKVILVNESTQSAAEYHAMGFQATENSLVVGSQTAGADGNVTRFPIPGGYYARFSGIGVFYPDGRQTQQVGVSIDVWSEPTVDGFRAGRDEVLEDGLRLLVGDQISEDEIRRIAARNRE